MYVRSRSGLGQVIANCDDAIFRFMYPGVCPPLIGEEGQLDEPAPPPPPPPPEPEPEPEDIATVYPTATLLDMAATQPADEPATETTEVLTTVTPGPGGGGGGGWSIRPELPPAPSETSIDVSIEPGAEADVTERGFGLLEVAIGAGLAWVLSSAYRDRKGKRR